jgi:LuxR family maltose regulon positive regulatory protein
LSPQEQRVLALLGAGLSYQDIARQLVVSVNTIKTQVKSIYQKLNVNNRQQAQEVARQLGPKPPAK